MKTPITFLFVVMLGVVLTQSYAQPYSLNIIKWTGADNSMGVNSIDKITFADNNLIIKNFSGTSESFDIQSIRKITFANVPSGNTDIFGKDKTISISLNAASELRLYHLLEGKQNIEIYSTTGHLIHKTILYSDYPILNVNQLNKGVYILKVNNQTIKFVKP